MSQEKKKAARRRILSFMLALCMIITAFPATSLWAAENQTEAANVTMSEKANAIVDKNTDETEAVSETVEEMPVVPEEDNISDDTKKSDVIESGKSETESLSDKTNEPNAKATDAAMRGNCGKDGGDNVKWGLESDGLYNTLVISGTGEMEDYGDGKNNPWGMFNDSIRTITIENGVANIGKHAFAGCGNGMGVTTNVNIPNSVTRIGDLAFCDCDHIVNIDIPDSVTSIGNRAFYGCGQLTNVKMSNNIVNIGEYAFYYCRWLSNIELPDSITEIGCYAFSNCADLTSVDIPRGITKIESHTFNSCDNLVNVSIPDGLTIIDTSAFENCTRLTNINLSSSVISVGVNAFASCWNLPSIFIPQSVTSIALEAFYNCGSLKDIYYEGGPVSWKSLDNYIATNTFNDGFAITHYTGSPHTAKIHFNSRAEDRKEQYAIPYPNDNDRAQEVFDCSLEECVNKTNSTTYNPQLAHMSIALCNAIFSYYSINQYQKIYAYQNLGFDAHTRIDDKLLTYSVGTKRVGNETLVLVIARGTVDFEEFVDNFNTGVNQSYHQGFHDAANVLYNGVVGFLQQQGLDLKNDNLRFVITGHSRGAAAANIMAARLVDEEIPQNNIYAYTFACPDVAVMNKSTINSCQCIFNIGNIRDVISWIPRAIWTESGEKNGLGKDSFWDKYGRSYWYCEEGYSDYSRDNEISLDLTKFLDEHSQIGYLYYLRNENQLSDYARRERATYLADLTLINALGYTLQAGDKAYKFCRFFGFACPVDVEVRTSDDQLAGKVVDNVPEETMPDRVRIYIEGDKKYVYILDSGDYTFHLTGTDDGTMEYSLREFNTETRQITTEKTFTKVVLTKGKQMTSQAVGYTSVSSNSEENISGTKLIVLDDKGEPEKEVLPDGEGTEVPITTTPSPSPEVSDSPSVSPSPSVEPEPSVTETPRVTPTVTPGASTETPTVSPAPPTITAVPSITPIPTNSPTPGGDIGNDIKVNRIKITGSSKKVAVGKKLKLKVTVSPANATNKAVAWKSSNAKYATVNSKGVATIKKVAGGKTVTITAIAEDGSGIKASYKVQCMKGVVKKVIISGKNTHTIKASKSIKLSAKVKATKGANKTLKWSSSNTKYAKVNNTGKVSTKKAGKGKTIKITATATDGSGKKATVKIKLK